jgi:two-component system invasion response regulator UvrY
LVSVFSSDESIEIIGQANDGDEAVLQTQNLSPDVVLMDINMPKLNGIEAAEKIKMENPFVKVLLLTMLNSRQFVFGGSSKEY